MLILEFLAANPHGSGVSDISRELSLPKNSVFRIVSTLHAHGYLRRDESTKAFNLSRKLLSLGYAAVDENNLIEKSLDEMRRLRDETGETVLIGTLVQNAGIVLEQVPSKEPVKFMINIGHQFPLHTAAPAKVMLAFLPLEEADAIIETIQFKRFTEMTITNPLQFRAELENIRNSGYSVDRGEEVDSLRCVAAPIFNHRGYPLASIWATGPSYRMRDGDFEWMARYTVDCAARISQSFGYSLLDDTLRRKGND